MRIKITEIEATSEDLRSNRTLCDALMGVLDRCFAYPAGDSDEDPEEGGQQ